jgi:hypothetical protein
MHSTEGNILFGTYGFIFAQSPSRSSTTSNSLTLASMHAFLHKSKPFIQGAVGEEQYQSDAIPQEKGMEEDAPVINHFESGR